MADNEQNRFLLALAGVQKTDYISYELPSSNSKGMQIGSGGCKAVILRVNLFDRNTQTNNDPLNHYIYYGNAQRQEFELPIGVNSPIIFCSDLSQVYVRVPTVNAGLLKIGQAIIYS